MASEFKPGQRVILKVWTAMLGYVEGPSATVVSVGDALGWDRYYRVKTDDGWDTDVLGCDLWPGPEEE